jgi:hypothetical protein
LCCTATVLATAAFCCTVTVLTAFRAPTPPQPAASATAAAERMAREIVEFFGARIFVTGGSFGWCRPIIEGLRNALVTGR